MSACSDRPSSSRSAFARSTSARWQASSYVVRTADWELSYIRCGDAAVRGALGASALGWSPRTLDVGPVEESVWSVCS